MACINQTSYVVGCNPSHEDPSQQGINVVERHHGVKALAHRCCDDKRWQQQAELEPQPQPGPLAGRIIGPLFGGGLVDLSFLQQHIGTIVLDTSRSVKSDQRWSL